MAITRRKFLIAGAACGAAGLLFKPDNNGEPYNSYFTEVNKQLRAHGGYIPSMLVDLDKVDHNITALKSILNPNTDLRIVAKSVPSPELLEYLMGKTQTNKLMLFHQPFLNHIAKQYPKSDVLLGKPMPVKAAHNFYRQLSEQSSFDPQQQLQWLIDSKQRLQQYLDLARTLGQHFKINVEIDVGLHRGGLQTLEQLDSMIQIIESNPEYLSFSGFMGYDPQIVKIPSIVKSPQQAFLESQVIYQSFITRLYQLNPDYKKQLLCFNGAGSPSLLLHKNNTVANELSAGSCFVKSTDFDIPSLDKFIPAAFIATPVLKKMTGTTLPAIEFAKDIIPLWDPNTQFTYFIYGGKWLATHESPKGLQGNGLFGTSTNQEIVNGSSNTKLNVDDYVFLRPSQSEAVFLQFGDITTLKNKKIINKWSILAQG